MSTRSITHIHEMPFDFEKDKDEQVICSFYRHCDGYPSGHGRELADWLKDKRLVNGIGSDFKEGRDFNRAGTMAVRLMAELQEQTSIEVIPTESNGHGEEYIYDVYFKEDGFYVKVTSGSCEVNVSAKNYAYEKIEALLRDE